jgi:hypothetical protein
LSNFTGVNLATIRYVRFKFNKISAGAILISDMTFVEPICGAFAGAYHDTVMKIGSTYKVQFTDSSEFHYYHDSATYYWNFGEVSSGTSDTSTLHNPFHTYAAAGTYTACVSVTIYQKSGIVCHDTVCKTIRIARLGVDETPEERISIVPNPARNFIRITGTERTDVITLVNMYGQVVFTSAVNDPVIYLPPSLATGMYTAIVSTSQGKVFKKLLIER